MPKVLVSIYSWEGPKLFSSDADLGVGDEVIVPTEYSNELGFVSAVNVETNEEPDNKILRVATERDREVFESYKEKEGELIDICRKAAKEHDLPLKVVDARTSLDGKQIIFVFTADGRIDFRELVKDLARTLKKTIRMHQIGSRDEARKLGGLGICGRELCCMHSQGSIQSITTDMARIQQISHRGTDRISGLCGRLMCCLAYEAEQYKEMLKGMPEAWSIVKTAEGRGTVMEINAISQEIKVKLENGKFVIIKKEDLKK